MGPVVASRRLGYRVAFRLLQVRWALQRPALRGVKCLIGDGDRVLLVRHTYGNRAWDLPGGASHRDETPEATARREMDEELGLGALPWRPLGELHGRMYHRHDTVHVLGATAPPGTTPTVDPGEIAVAAWFQRTRLPLWQAPLLHHIITAGLLTDDATQRHQRDADPRRRPEPPR